MSDCDLFDRKLSQVSWDCCQRLPFSTVMHRSDLSLPHAGCSAVGIGGINFVLHKSFSPAASFQSNTFLQYSDFSCLLFSACHEGEDPLAGDQNDHDMDSIAGVLKLYFRGLEHPLFPKDIFHDLIACVSKYMKI